MILLTVLFVYIVIGLSILWLLQKDITVMIEELCDMTVSNRDIRSQLQGIKKKVASYPETKEWKVNIEDMEEQIKKQVRLKAAIYTSTIIVLMWPVALFDR